MIPYVKLGDPEDWFQILADKPELMESLPVLGVVVGPTRYSAEAEDCVRKLLRSHGHESVDVVLSRIPFRS
ncbi:MULTISPECIES: hypothetical protein [Arthrobacter]|uniref:Uncharacterized protein n=1 Tax=Arthrobacter terricola TaxID=2547396 RepID=A0A4R5KCD3_9MICC|nr:MULTISPECIES: hypothetical protein [Arthrobacter]MBT8163006.1 hypothetical protein [Arthrobacter sp. GN70]TDF91787.1 hypothetical protein E1809_19915 [Arthrobacter terricola]